MQEREQQAKPSATAQVDFSRSVTLGGITGAVSSSDKSFVAKAGEFVITVTGECLSPKLIDVENKKAVIEGKISSVTQSRQLTPKGFFARLFK